MQVINQPLIAPHKQPKVKQFNSAPYNSHGQPTTSQELLLMGSSDFLERNDLVTHLQASFGISTKITNNAQTALFWLEQKANRKEQLPIGILCEWELLQTNNFSLSEGLQANDALKNVPLVALSSRAQTIDLKETIERGISDFYVAPFQLADIVDRIDFLNHLKHLEPSLNPVDDVPFDRKIPFAKRSFDVVASFLALLFLSPLLAMIAALIKLESPGPIFYSSKRVGTGYHIFDFYKFRSMRADADSQLNKLLHLNQYDNDNPNQQQNGVSFVKIENDPRITRIGRLIRRSSLDELPQLFNVLKGDMSIVGNRPLPLYEAEQLTRDVWAMRFLAPAGLTGLWQVTKRGKKNMSAAERIALDNTYAQNYSILFDLKIILKTIPAMFQHEEV